MKEFNSGVQEIIGEAYASTVLDYSSVDVNILTTHPAGARLYVQPADANIAVVDVAYVLMGDGTTPRTRKVVVPGYAPGRAKILKNANTTAGLTIEAHV